MINKRLQAFRLVAKYLSFTRAADELNVSQPNITHHIRSLEKELGFKVVDTSDCRDIKLTKEGEKILIYANCIDQEERNMLSYAEGVVWNICYTQARGE